MMSSSVPITTAEIPADSALGPFAARADFRDSYAAALHDPDLSPTALALRVMGASPDWVSRLMDLRNALVRPFGLKDTGRLNAGVGRPASSYQVGDRLGIFSILAVSDREIVLGIDDSHLDVRVSIVKADPPSRYVVTTAVVIHNLIGRLYMIPVGRIHPVVVRAQMRRARL